MHYKIATSPRTRLFFFSSSSSNILLLLPRLGETMIVPAFVSFFFLFVFDVYCVGSRILEGRISLVCLALLLLIVMVISLLREYFRRLANYHRFLGFYSRDAHMYRLNIEIYNIRSVRRICC